MVVLALSFHDGGTYFAVKRVKMRAIEYLVQLLIRKSPIAEGSSKALADRLDTDIVVHDVKHLELVRLLNATPEDCKNHQ